MPLRIHFFLLGPIGAMLVVHIAGLVMYGNGWLAPVGGGRDLWGPWNVAGPIFLLIAAGQVLRRMNEEEAPAPSRLARITWGVALADLAVTAVIAATLLRHP